MTCTHEPSVTGAGFHHQALVYGSEDEFLGVAVPFLRDGAAAGEPTLLAVAEPLQRRLLAEVDAPGAVTVLAPDHYRGPWQTLRDTFALHARLVDDGATRIRMLGAIPQEPWQEWVQYEALINRVFAAVPVWGICPYDSRSTSEAILDDVERTHPHLSITGMRRSAYEDPVTFVNGRNRADGERLDATPPDIELACPAGAQARAALTWLADRTTLEDDEIDTLCLCVAALITNAAQHGRPPIRLRAWAGLTHLEVLVRDAGPGPADASVGLLPRADPAHPEDQGTMHLIHQAVSGVALYTDETGFSVRLTQRATV